MLSADVAVEEDRGQHHRGDDRHRVGLEEVGGHAGAVADIVADIVGDRRGVARIVLGNAGFHLADEVAADIGALGEDAAAETGEDGDERGAEAERDERVDDVAAFRVETHRAGQDPEIDGDAEEREAGHQQPGDGAGAEGDGEAGGERLRGGLRRAHIGAHRDEHADEAGGAREDRADGEAEGGDRRKQEPGDDEDDDADDGDGRVLAGEIGGGALADGGGNLLHAGVAGIGREHRLDRPGGIDDAQHAADDDEIQRKH